MSRVDDFLQRLERVPQEDALAIVNALEDKDRKNCFVKYWQAQEPQTKIFPEFTSDLKIFGILGGNRSGKSETSAFMAVAWALGKEYFEGSPAYEYVKHLPIPKPPSNIWIVALDFPTLRDVLWREKLLQGRNHPGFLPNDPFVVRKKSEADFQIFLHNGSVITGKSADSGREKFQGASVDLALIDEECESEVFDEIYQRTVDCRGKIILSLTPLTDIASGVRVPWVFDLYQDSKLGKSDAKFVQLSVLDNPYVPEDEKTKLIEKWKDHPEEKARLYGQFVQRSGLVYPQWTPAKHLVDPFRIPSDWQRIVSLDPAATGTTAALWIAVSEQGNLYLYREYYERDKIVSDHAKNILMQNAGDKIDVWIIDKKWGTQRNAETHKQNMQLYREAGIPVRLAVVGEDYGMNESREYMSATLNESSRHPKVYVFKNLHNFRFEVEHYVWDAFSKGENKGLSKEKPRKRSDHLLNAWQYACAMRPRGKGRPILTEQQKLLNVQLNSYTT
jgi:phage terminase large subunit-like protein